MSVVTFWNSTNEQNGTTSSAIALAVRSAIQHNIKILFISTSLNNEIIQSSFWKEKENKTINFITGKEKIKNTNTNDGNIEKNGVEGLERLMRSNKITPERITEYTKILLRDRLEVLLGIYRRR